MGKSSASRLGALRAWFGFMKLATESGWSWFVEAHKYIAPVSALLLLLGVSFVSYQISDLWLAAFVALLIYLLIFSQGAYRTPRPSSEDFPKHDQDVKGTPWYWYVVKRDERFMILNFRFTNRQTDANMNLRPRLVLVHRMSHPSRNDLRHSLGDFYGPPLSKGQLISPIDLGPMKTIDGFLAFPMTDKSWFTFAPEHNFYVRDRTDLELEVEDYVTGQKLVIPVETPRAPEAEPGESDA